MNDIFIYWPADECKGLTYQEKNKRASEKWKEQNDSQRKKFEDSAKVHKELNVKVSELTDDQRKKLIYRHRKKLLEEVMFCSYIFKLDHVNLSQLETFWLILAILKINSEKLDMW